MGFFLDPLIQNNSGFMFIISVVLLLFRLVFSELYRLRKGGERLACALYQLQGEHNAIHQTSKAVEGKEESCRDEETRGRGPCIQDKGGLNE